MIKGEMVGRGRRLLLLMGLLWGEGFHHSQPVIKELDSWWRKAGDGGSEVMLLP